MKGVNSAELKLETKMIHVSYDQDKVKLIDIHKTIAKAKHDT